MKKLCLAVFLILFFVSFFSGCSNPVNTTVSDLQSAGEVDRLNAASLDFYVWRYVPYGMNPAVRKAYIDIYQGTTLIRTVGVTSSDGKYSIPASSLPKGNYTVYAYTLVGNYPDYFGVKNFYHSTQQALVTIEVSHS